MQPTRYDVLLTMMVGAAHRPAAWESSLQATCDCLSWRGTLGTLERRQAEDELSEHLYVGLPVPVLSALVTAHALLDKGVIAEDELEAKMKEVWARFEAG
jgi:hypothetical protein